MKNELPKLRRAPAPAKTIAEHEPLDLCLSIWRDWMQSSDRDLGAKTMRGLTGEGDGYGGDVHDQQRANDMRVAEATDAMISSLPRIAVWSIYRAYSISTAWRFPSADFEQEYMDARTSLEILLRKNICTSVLF